MQYSKTKNASRNIIWGFVYRILFILFPFVLKSIIIYTLGKEYIGLNSLFTAILNCLNIAELGFGSAMVFHMYRPIAENDEEKICSILKFYRKVYRNIGFFVLTVGIIIMPFLPKLINGTPPADINLYVLFSIYLVQTVIGYFFYAYKNSLLAAHQRRDVEYIVNIIVNILIYSLQILLLILFKNFYTYALLVPVSTLANNLFIAWRVSKMYPKYVCRGEISFELKKDIKKKISSLMTHKIGTLIIASVDSIIIARIFDLNILASFSVYFTIMASIEIFINILFQSITGGIGNSVITQSVEKNKEIFNKIFFLTVWITIWCSVCLFCLYQPFIIVYSKITNSSLLLDDLTMMSFCALFFVAQLGRVVKVFKDGLGLWYEDRFKPIVMVFVKIGISILLCFLIGVKGTLIATIFTYLFISIPWENFVLFKKYFKTGRNKYLLLQLTSLLLVSIIAALTYYLCSFIPVAGIMGLMLKFGVCIIAPNVVFVLIFFKTKIFKDSTKMVFNAFKNQLIPKKLTKEQSILEKQIQDNLQQKTNDKKF